MSMAEPLPKPVIWMGDSREVLRDFPALVQDEVGFALYRAQVGSKHASAKPLKGFGSGVLEVLSDHRGNTFSGGVHRPSRGDRLCPPRLPEEVDDGDRDARS